MKNKQIKIGSLLSYVSIIISTLITLIYTPLILSVLGKAEYGVYELTVSIVSYLSLLSLGFGGSYVRFFYRYKSRDDNKGINKLNGLFLIVYLIMALVALVSGFFITNNLEFILSGKLTLEELVLSKRLMSILVINIALTLQATVFEAFLTANEAFIFQRTVVLLRQIFNPLLGIPILLMGYRSTGLVVVMTFLTLTSLIVNGFYAIKKLNMKFSFGNIDTRLFKEIFIFSSFVFLNMITDQINWAVDKFVLGKVVGSVSITIYSMGAFINKSYLQFSTAISSMFIPRVNNLVQSGAKDEELTDIFIKVGRIQFIIMMLILTGFLAFGEYFITNIWLDPSYETSYYVAVILIVPVTIPLIQNIGIEIQKAKNMHVFRSVLYFIIALFNVIISIPLAKAYGPVGSAIGTSVALILGNIIVMNYYYHNQVGINIIEFWKSIFSIFKGMLIPIIVMFIIKNIVVIDSKVLFLVYILIYVFIYIICLYKFSLSKEEKNMFNKILKKGD